MRYGLAIVVGGLASMGVMAPAAQQQQQVSIRVDTAARKGPMHPFWAWFGHDEPNYTYTANGKKLLSALQDLSPVPVFVRVHNLLTSGDGKHALKWGSTDVYSVDAGGRAVYDWTILDRIVDTYIARKMKPFVQLGFMPEPLSSAPTSIPYRHFWKPGDPYNDIYTGWTTTVLPGHEALCREVWPCGSGELVVRGLERARHRLLERLGWAERGSRRSSRRREGSDTSRRVQHAVRLLG